MGHTQYSQQDTTGYLILQPVSKIRRDSSYPSQPIKYNRIIYTRDINTYLDFREHNIESFWSTDLATTAGTSDCIHGLLILIFNLKAWPDARPQLSHSAYAVASRRFNDQFLQRMKTIERPCCSLHCSSMFSIELENVYKAHIS
ncbi:hypothetical protein PoB_006017900 [Plakobranchus ocellatus]|uniref:Uncharacterized protein n=1 Tax=Plakobranchus ocellatus TaxID=259542 RepID=A0AAV4CP87_9GAST|nr:hypothetical protein PoB_006017900 [Plakobranchus ocellatus]